MPSDVVLSRGIRTNLLTLQDHSANLEISQQRLATGKKINSALDNPLSYFAADGLRYRGSQLASQLDQMGLSIKVLEQTGKAIEAIQKLAESAIGIIKSASASTDNRSATRRGSRSRRSSPDQQPGAGRQFQRQESDERRRQRKCVQQRVRPAGSLNETLTTSLDIQAINLRATGLAPRAGRLMQERFLHAFGGDTAPAGGGFPDRTTATDYDSGVAGDATMQRDLTYLQGFVTGVRNAASNFGINLTILQNRQQFTKDSVLTLNLGADGLVLSDQNEEGAKLLALQTRQQLSTQALSLANQADQAVLRLFS